MLDDARYGGNTRQMDITNLVLFSVAMLFLLATLALEMVEPE